ncbi:MAG: tetratricopeptide repeat protein [Candidatus Omnitrophica bacterium]|nr:tetratricopeptide repeat protein [Candidatus Omnitrophota bacterium]
MYKIIKIFVIMLFFAQAAGFSFADEKAKDLRKGNKLFRKGDYEQSVKYFQDALTKDPEAALTNYNIGTAFYKTSEFDKAAVYIEKALLSDDINIREKAYYNRGNILYRLAREKEAQCDLDGASKSMEQSVESYDEAVKLLPKDKDAEFNIDLVKQEIERVANKKKLPRKKWNADGSCEQKQNSKSDQNNKENKPDKNKQDQNKQGQPQPDKSKPDNQPDQNQKNNEQKSDDKAKDQSEQNKDKNPDNKKNDNDGKDNDNKQNDKRDQNNKDGQGEQSPESQKDPQTLLNDYQNNEEPKGTLNLNPQKAIGSVSKDW